MKATYVSIWDGDRIMTVCDYNPQTNTVSNIETVEISNEYNTCEREFIELPNGDEIDIDHLIIED